ncbi:MAG: CBS domain-containing protein [Candidatus Micrarchaeota archaeon]
MKVSEIMHGVTVLNETVSVQFAACVMRDKGIGSVLVERKDGVICGIMTERDVLKKIVAEGLNPGSTTLREVMTSSLITIREDADVAEASALLNKFHIRRLPVVNAEGKIVGITTARDVAKSFAYLQVHKILGESDREYARVGFFEHLQ